MELYLNAALLTLLSLVTIAIIRERNLFGSIILFSVYSFIMASLMIVLDAVDVALTEAAVGSGISTVVLLGTLHLIKAKEELPTKSTVLPLTVVAVTGLLLVWGTSDLPVFGVSDAPIHKHVTPYYLEQSIPLMGIPNVVTTVLGNFRSFDTLGETTVVLTAGVGIMLL